MPAPFDHVDAAAFMGSWPLVPYFSGTTPAVLPGTLLDRATLLSARRETSSGFTVVGRSFKIWIDAVGPITVTFTGSNPLTLDEVVTQINTAVSGGYGQTVAYKDNGFLRLRSAILGQSSYLKIDTDAASSPADVFFELGLFAGLESRGGQLVSAPIVDPDRQVALPDQFPLSHGEDLGYSALNRSLVQLALNTDQTQGYFRRGMAKTDLKDVAISAAGFTLTGEHVYCGKIASGSPQDDTIVILDQNDNEVVTEHAVDVDTGLNLDFWYDPETQKQYVDATSGTPFVSGDDTGDFYVVVTTGGSFGALEQMKILEVVSGTRVVVMNVVEADGTEVEVGTQATPVSITDGIRRRIDSDRLYATDFLDAPAGSSVINQAVEIVASTAITRVERNNRLFCDSATFITDDVKVDDVAVIANHNTDIPYSNDGSYRVLKVIDEKTLELVAMNSGPAVLNPLSGGDYGDVTIKTDTNFYYEPYVELSYSPPSGTYRVVFKKHASLESLVDDVDSFSASPTRFIQETSTDIQRIVKSILGPSATSFSDPLYGDERNSLENLYFRLNQEHDDAGRHTTIQPDNVFIGMTSSDTINDGNVIFKAGDVPLFGFRISNSNAYLDLDASWSGSETTPVLRIGRNARYVGIGDFGASTAPATLLHVKSDASSAVGQFQSDTTGAYVALMDATSTDQWRWEVVGDAHRWWAGGISGDPVATLDDTGFHVTHWTEAVGGSARFDCGSLIVQNASASYSAGFGTRFSFYANTAGAAISHPLAAVSSFSASGSASSAGKMIFETNNGTLLAPKMFLDEDGHLWPDDSTNQDLGLTANRWGTLFATAGAIGTAPFSNNVALNLERTSAANANEYTILAEHILSTAFTNAKTGIGADINDDHTGGTISDVRAFFASFDGGAGDLTAYYGYRSIYTVSPGSSGPVIASLYNFYAEGTIGAFGEVTNLYGFRYSEGSISGTVGTQFGMRIGALTSASTNYGVYVQQVPYAANNYGLFVADGRASVQFTHENTANEIAFFLVHNHEGAGSAAQQRGIYAQCTIDCSSNHTGAWTGIQSIVEKRDAFDHSAFVGFRASAGPRGTPSGSVANYYGYFSECNATGFDITSIRHFYVGDAAGTGTVTTQYGLYVTSLVKASTNWAVYTTGTTPSYFGGAIGIGTTALGAKLDVVGDIAASSGFTGRSSTASIVLAGGPSVSTGGRITLYGQSHASRPNEVLVVGDGTEHDGNILLQPTLSSGVGDEDQEERCIAVTCRNNSAVNAIPAGGIVVNPSAYSGSEIPVQVTASSANDQIFGIALETIAASGTGRVAIAGIVEVLVDTNGAAAGFHVVTSGAAASGAAGGTSSPTTGTVLGRYLNTVSGAAGAKAWALIGTNSG